MRRLLLSTLAIVVPFVVFVLLAEGVLRVLGYEPSRSYKREQRPTEEVYLEFNPDFGWMAKEGRFRSREEGQVWMNIWPNGQRKYWEVPDKPATETVAMIGGSFTLGYGVEDEDTFVYRLNGLHPDVRFENYGVGGYGTYQSLLRMRRILEDGMVDGAKPDLFLYGMIGDHGRRNVASVRWVKRRLAAYADKFYVPPHVWFEGDSLVEIPSYEIPLWPLERHSAIVGILHEVVMRLEFGDRDERKDDVILLLAEQLQREANADGVPFMAILFDNLPEDFPERLDALGVPYINCINPEFHTNPVYRNGGKGHPSPLQHEEWTDCIQRGLEARFDWLALEQTN